MKSQRILVGWGLALVFALTEAEPCWAQGGGTAFASNGQTNTISTPNFAVFPDPNSNITGHAKSVVSPSVSNVPDITVPKSGGSGQITVGPANAAAGGTTASATASFSTLTSGTNIIVGTAGTVAMVTAGNEVGTALASVTDPAIYDNAGGRDIYFTSSVDAGAGFSLGSLGSGSSSITMTAGSNIPGFSTFYNLTLSTDGSDPGTLDVVFSSNPLLGINDAAVQAEFASNMIYSPGTGTFSADSSFTYLDFTVTVPEDQSTVSFTDSSAAFATAAPEPSSLIMMVSASMIVGTVVAIRRKQG